MTTMVAEIYDALVSAGASDDKARAAATAIAGYDQAALKADLAAFRSEAATNLAAFRSEASTNLAALRSEAATKSELAAFRAEVKAELGAVKTDVAILKWSAGLTVACLLSLVAKAYF